MKRTAISDVQNVTVVRYKFNKRSQGSNENIEQVCNRTQTTGKRLVAKLSIATGHAMQIYNCLNCPRQL